MKKRLIFALFIFILVAAFLLPLVTANIDQFLKSQTSADGLISENYGIIGLSESWSVVLQSARALQIWVMSSVILALLLFLLTLQGAGIDHRSRMQRITPDIVTPCADGQGQCGTARWMSKGEIRKVFSLWKVPVKSTSFKALLRAGKADRKEIRNADIQLS